MHTGLIKLKLVHASGFSVLLPDLVAADIDGWKWFQPKYFTACVMAFFDEGSVGTLWIDFLEEGATFRIQFRSEDFIRRFDDGAQLFRCSIVGASELALVATGTCILDDDDELFLNLFHHTTDDARDSISQSGHLRASRWNIQGTKKLNNIGYVYLTSLPAIKSDEDLHKIAMASTGKITFLPTNAISMKDAISITVYRESTMNRTATVEVSVSASLIASQHVYRHAPHDRPVYYEICHPEILRVGLIPEAVLAIAGSHALPVADEQKRFDYVVLGDADTAEGFTAPYDEENTRELFLVERCKDETIFDFWRQNTNQDLYQGRDFELMTFRPTAET